MRNPVTALASTVVCGVLLAGCAVGGSEPEPDPEAESACELLSTDDVVALAGEDLGEPEPGDATGLPACRWGSPAGIGVQVIDVPVADWVANLEPALDQIEASDLGDDPETAAKLQEARDLLASGDPADLGDAGGCELFSLFLEIQGLAPGQSRAVNVIPDQQSPEAVSGQSCADGHFSSVLIQGSQVTGSADEVDRVEAALDAVIARSSG
jgi:hypothetical protein